MIVSSQTLGNLDFLQEKPIHLQFGEDLLSPFAGLLLLRQFDEKIGWTKRICDALEDPRDPTKIQYSFLQLFRARLYALLAGYPDQLDHNTLRNDPILQMVADLCDLQEPLASQATYSRFENAIDTSSLLELRDVWIDAYLDSFEQPPSSLLFDLDGVDDPTHGQQQLSFYQGYFGQHQYFPLILTCAKTDQVVLLSLRHGTAHVTLAADSDLEYLVNRIRQRWPDVAISIRADAGFGSPKMYEVCERLNLDYTLGIASNAVLKRHTQTLLEQGQQQYQDTGQPQRLFRCFCYRARSWDRHRTVIVKCEVNALGSNRRYVVSNRLGASCWPEATYEEYVQRGESENRNKELKCDLQIDRLSDHRFAANLFRLYLHSAAYNLLVRLRQEVSAPVPLPGGESALPLECQSASEQKSYQNRCRREDPLGEGHLGTWVLLVIGVCANIVVQKSRIVVNLSGCWPNRCWFVQVFEHLQTRPAVPHFFTG